MSEDYKNNVNKLTEVILSPIVLFVYNRPWHTQQTVEALQKNELAKESELFIYSDEAKNEDARKSVNEVRKYIDKIDGFKKITVIKREKNWGLADSIIDGVTKIVNEYGKIIVLEDDLVTSPYFLNFMNEALDKYQTEQKVYSITGYSFSNDVESIDSTYFLKLTSAWSWGTWKDKWHSFSHDKILFNACLEKKYKFNYDDVGSRDFIVRNNLKRSTKWTLCNFSKLSTIYMYIFLTIRTFKIWHRSTQRKYRRVLECSTSL